MAKTETLSPTEIWRPRNENFRLETAIEAAREDMNALDSDHLINHLRDLVTRSDRGVEYAVLKGPKPDIYSDTEALVLFNAFASTATDNMLVHAEFIRRVAQKAGVTDQSGKLKPVVMLASPGIHSTKLTLDKSEKEQIRTGDLGPAAREMLATISAMEYGRVALLGFSQGADMAISGAKNASGANLDVTSMSVGEPAAITDRTKMQLAADFLRSSGQFQSSVKNGGLEAQYRAIGKTQFSPARNVDFIRFAGVSLTPTNRLIWSALSKDTFESNIQEIMDNGRLDKIVVGYGGSSRIAGPGYIEASLQRLHEQVADNRLISIKVEGRDHSWGDELPLLAKLYLRALV